MSVNTPIEKGAAASTAKVIFAVDDEPMLLELIALVLEPIGYRVQTYRDPAAAVRAFTLANPPPALVITDYAMHSMNGMDLIRECRKANPAQKIILVSGTVDENIYRTSAIKPDLFLAKPYQAKELAETVRTMIGA
ncbi:MAG TPA: response regulator [Verrucomicrobiota bacterium]|nr:response regulator [Verrucomicrobiota bacterium]